MDTTQTGITPTNAALTTVFSLGFKFLAWLNGLGVLLVFACATGMIQTDLAPQWLRLPLTAFLCGLVLCGLGLLWSYLVLASLFGQMVRGQTQRTHWIPLFCAMLAYSLSMAAFVAGCWFTLGLSSLVYQLSETSSSSDDSVLPSDQFGEGSEYIHDANRKTVWFPGTLTIHKF